MNSLVRSKLTTMNTQPPTPDGARERLAQLSSVRYTALNMSPPTSAFDPLQTFAGSHARFIHAFERE